jgi:hypothetical protein
MDYRDHWKRWYWKTVIRMFWKTIMKDHITKGEQMENKSGIIDYVENDDEWIIMRIVNCTISKDDQEIRTSNHVKWESENSNRAE